MKNLSFAVVASVGVLVALELLGRVGSSVHRDIAWKQDTMFSEVARLYLARAYEAKGDKAKAAEVAVSRSVYRSFSGGTLIRLDTDYNDIMREVAAGSHVALLDGAKVLEERPSAFIDFCHFNADGHRRLGEALAGRISEILAMEPTNKLP